ncbi:hypothetical protein FGO68_gene17653 [Halteria grandinella]|uniref:Uncharacterized protein n=1 Tax=Halteria grandinella TaxID=5974 RepID=A0A8J8T2C9_HALGN|nr:hypothetical protein FGO68_gene17653 [Halteria grandinella]
MHSLKCLSQIRMAFKDIKLLSFDILDLMREVKILPSFRELLVTLSRPINDDESILMLRQGQLKEIMHASHQQTLQMDQNYAVTNSKSSLSAWTL